MRPVLVISVNTECWAEIDANIGVESADGLFNTH